MADPIQPIYRPPIEKWRAEAQRMKADAARAIIEITDYVKKLEEQIGVEGAAFEIEFTRRLAAIGYESLDGRNQRWFRSEQGEWISENTLRAVLNLRKRLYG